MFFLIVHVYVVSTNHFVYSFVQFNLSNTTFLSFFPKNFLDITAMA